MVQQILSHVPDSEDRLQAGRIGSTWREEVREPAAEALAQRIRQGDVTGAVAELQRLTYGDMLHLLEKAMVRIARAHPEDLPKAVAVVNEMIGVWPRFKDGLLTIVFDQLRSKRRNPSTRRYAVMGGVKLEMWKLIEKHYNHNWLKRGGVLASLRDDDPVFDQVPRLMKRGRLA